MYEYIATVAKVIDGDTIDVDVDLGFDIHHKVRLRLAGINAPEMHAADSAPGVAARDYLIELLGVTPVLLPPTVRVLTEKDHTEKYGRYLAQVWMGKSVTSVNQQMIESGHAVAYEGGAR